LLGRAPSRVESVDFRPSLCAAACRHLLPFGAVKGQEKGNARRHDDAIQAGFRFR
jgi:hypothetical protein